MNTCSIFFFFWFKIGSISLVKYSKPIDISFLPPPMKTSHLIQMVLACLYKRIYIIIIIIDMPLSNFPYGFGWVKFFVVTTISQTEIVCYLYAISFTISWNKLIQWLAHHYNLCLHHVHHSSVILSYFSRKVDCIANMTKQIYTQSNAWPSCWRKNMKFNIYIHSLSPN